MSYRELLDSAIRKAYANGYRIGPVPIFVEDFKICDPIGAVWAFEGVNLDKEFAQVLIRSFDGMVVSARNDAQKQAIELGKEYREKFIIGNA